LNLTVTYIIDASCSGTCDGMATAMYIGGTAPYSLSWGNGQTDIIATGLCAGSHNVTVTDDNNCETISNVIIDEPDPVGTNQISGGTTSCFGDCDGTIELSSNGGTAPYLYNWLPDVSNSSNASGLCEGSYTVQTIDGNGCILNADFLVTSPSVLEGVISKTNATCESCNGTATLSGTGGTMPYDYQWSNGQISQISTALCIGNIEGTIIDANGCQYVLDTNIINLASPEITDFVSVNPTCNGSINGIASVNFINGSSPFSFNWSQSPLDQATAIGLGDGTHCVEVIDANGCTDLACVELIEPSSVVAVIDGQDTLCYGDSTQIWASASGGSGEPYSINWVSNNASSFSGGGPIMVNPDSSSFYCFTASDVNGCLSSDPGCIGVYVHPSLMLAVSNDIYICPGDNVEFNTETSGGSGDPYSFEWYLGSIDSANFVGSDSLLVIQDSLLTLPSDTSVMYYVTMDDGCSLPSVDSVKLIVNPIPEATIELLDSNGCATHDAQFMVHTDIGSQYIWDIDCDGETDITTSDSIVNYAYSDPGIYDLCVTVISDSGCVNTAFDSSAIEVYPVPISNFLIAPPYTTLIDPTMSINNLSVGDSIWRWDLNSDGIVDDTINHDPIYEHEAAGDYQITLVVENEYGCIDTHVETFVIGKDEVIFVPNTFTPDDDGINDFFFAETSNIVAEDFELLIFNRWGEFIWGGYTQDARWDGILNGVKSQQDTYVWKIKYKDLNGNDVELLGHVNLVR